MQIIHFNWLHPREFVHEEWNKTSGNKTAGFNTYTDWLMKKGYGMGDIFTSNFVAEGFRVSNIYWSDNLFVQKFNEGNTLTSADALLLVKYLAQLPARKIYSLLSLKSARSLELSRIKLLKHIITQNAKIIVIREPAGLDHQFLKTIKKITGLKVVCLVGCEFKYIPNFNPLVYDSVFVLTKENVSYFNSVDMVAIPFNYGWFDYTTERVYNYDIVFIGDLFNEVQKTKTVLMNNVAMHYNFKWWGPCNVDAAIYPALYNSYQGAVAGNAMLDIYAAAKLVLNDYPANAGGDAVNMRIWEVLSAGSFLLTRDAESLSDLIKNGGLSVFKTDTECIRLIQEFLVNDEERERKANHLKNYCKQKYSLNNNIKRLKDEINLISGKN